MFAFLPPHSLAWLVVLPFLAGCLCLLAPRSWAQPAAWFSVAVAGVIAWLAWPHFLAGPTTQVLPGGLTLHLDKLSGFILLVVCAFGLLITLYSTRFMRGKPGAQAYYGYILWTLAAACGVLLANDLVFLLGCWGFLGLTLYLLMSLSGPAAADAAKKTFVIIGGSDSILIFGAGILWLLNGTLRLDGPALPLTGTAAYLAFLAFAVAAFTKAGAMPFHTWVPDCGEKAYVPVTAFLPAALDKLLGIYLLTRAATAWFVMNHAMNTLLLIVGAVTVLVAVMMALVQHDLKRLLAYHAVSQVGYMVLGIATGLPLGIAGGLFHLLNNAVYKSSLFLVAGAVETTTGTTDMDRLGGLAKFMPLTFFTCLVGALAISGVPPLNGFTSKWMVYQSLLVSAQQGGLLWIFGLAAAMVGSALTLASFVKVLHAVFLAPPSPERAAQPVREVGWAMTLPMLLLAATSIVFGVAAFRIPLQGLIFPALSAPVTFAGTWWAGPATVLLLASVAVGLLLYALGKAWKVRRAPQAYIGGEILEEGVQVTGADFYLTLQELPPFGGLYRLASKKFFDVYDVGRGVIFYFVETLRNLHNGVLARYLTWFLSGLVILIFMLGR